MTTPPTNAPEQPFPDERDESGKLYILAAFCRDLSVTHRFAFDGNERDALRQAGEALAKLAEAGR